MVGWSKVCTAIANLGETKVYEAVKLTNYKNVINIITIHTSHSAFCCTELMQNVIKNCRLCLVHCDCGTSTVAKSTRV